MTTNNKYGHLLDKYMDYNNIDYKTKQEREEETKNKYVDYSQESGHILVKNFLRAEV